MGAGRPLIPPGSVVRQVIARGEAEILLRMAADAAPVAGGATEGAGWAMGSLRWADFEAAVPELAARGRALIERFGFILAGTIRADGTPRISPVAAHLVSGDLMLVMIPGTQKARDVRRDSRIVLQSPVTGAAEPGAEFKLRGRAAGITGDALRTATADTIETVSGWRPPANLAVPGRHRAGRCSPGMDRRGDDADALGRPASRARAPAPGPGRGDIP